MEQLPSQIILQVTGKQVNSVRPIGRGATSIAWRVDCGDDHFVVRVVPENTNRPVTYLSEFTILRELYRRGGPVPEPILCSAEASGVSMSEVALPWAVTRAIAGTPLTGRRMTPEVAHELGMCLATLHTLPQQGYGRLQESDKFIQGQQHTPLAGILARWCWSSLWPFDATCLEQHPLSWLFPDVVAKIERLAPAIRNVNINNQNVVLHSDLYGEHIFELQGQLSGVIDFGAAFIGLPAWEFAVLAYYHGWLATETILATYNPLVTTQKIQTEEVKLLAIVVALYKLSKITHPSVTDVKVQRIGNFIRETLNR